MSSTISNAWAAMPRSFAIRWRRRKPVRLNISPVGRRADDRSGARGDRDTKRQLRRTGLSAIGLRLSYREFARTVDDAARGLLALGIGSGEHVAIWATNVPQWVMLQFATARIGAVLVTINPAYRPFELKYVLHQSDAVALFLVDRFKTSDYFAMLAEVCPELATSDPGQLQSPGVSTLALGRHAARHAAAGTISWDEMLPPRPKRSQPNELSAAGDSLQPGRRDQHPIHFRHDRLSQGGHAQPSQPAAERLLRRPVPETHRARPDLHSGAVLSLLRLRAGHDRAPWCTARP